MSLFSRKPLTAEEALEQVRAKTGKPCALRVRSSGRVGVTLEQRVDALAALTEHEARRPRLTFEENCPDDMTIGEYRAARESERTSYGEWQRRKDELRDVAYAFTYSFTTGRDWEEMEIAWSTDSPAHTLEEALSRVMGSAKRRA